MYNLIMLNQDLLNKMQNDITEFRTVFGLSIGGRINDDDDALHTSLFVEELGELSDADNDVERMDAIVDSVYVLMGRVVHEYGDKGLNLDYVSLVNPCLYVIDALMQIADNNGWDFAASWDAVHYSNMSKVCDSIDEAKRTRVKYLGADILTKSEKVGKYYVITCVQDNSGKGIKPGKVLKSIDYSPVNLTEVMYGSYDGGDS